jgi:hypothetical protein
VQVARFTPAGRVFPPPPGLRRDLAEALRAKVGGAASDSGSPALHATHVK